MKTVLKVVRGILLALLLSFLVGIAIGTLLRRRMERPVRYIGAVRSVDAPWARSAVAAGPLDVADARPGILAPGEDEEQVG